MGVTITNRTNHYHLQYGDKWTIMKRHPSQDFKNSHFMNILKQLGIKDKS